MKICLTLSRFLFSLLLLNTFKVSAQMQHPSLNHIALSIYDLKKSTDFYKDIIGLQEIPEPFHDGKHTWFKIAEHSQLHLIQGALAVTDHDKNSHVCFTVSSIDSVIKVLTKNNVWFGNWPGEPGKVTTRPDGVKQIFLKDPDGYWIEINNDTY
jgi:lactoylglutathione lyase